MKRVLGYQTLWLFVALQLTSVISGCRASQYAALEMVERVTKAVPTDEVVVVVHQLPELQEQTISLLDHPLYTNSPRVMLTDGASYRLTTALVERATLVQYSKQGELSLNLDARTVTLIGGAAQDCMRRSGKLLIEEMLDHRKQQSLIIRIPSHVVWGWKQEAGGSTLNDSFCRGNPDKFDSKINEFAETFINKGKFSDEFSMTHIDQIEPGREGSMDYSLVFTRKSDGREVTLIIELRCD